MTNPGSPMRQFNGYEDDPIFYEANFTQDINDRMRVPKRIRATGDYSDDDHMLSNQNGIMNSWNYSDKIDMSVPDRIVVLGHDQHLGTRSAPREILLENSILPKDPGFVRVATPPRIITLNSHHFPTATDDDEYNERQTTSGAPSAGTSPPFERSNNQQSYYQNKNQANTNGYDPLSSPVDVSSERQMMNGNGVLSVRKGLNFPNGGYQQQLLSMSGREMTPPIGEHLTPSEEVMHLRRQLAKLNRRVLSVEIDNVQRQQREKIIYCLGLAYFLMKAIYWLNRN